jgi:F-type H+-transporting ATPase subunit epsilon
VSKIKLDIVTAERVVYSGDVDEIVAPGISGQLGILPHHAPLMTILQAGELVAKNSGRDEIMAISGGFLEVRPDRVIVLADAAERAEEIDLARAATAKQRAEERLRDRKAIGLDQAAAEAALKRAMARLSVAEKIQQRRRM